MTYEEMMEIEEARFVAERKAWDRLHGSIYKEVFNKTDRQVLTQELAVEQ